ncbi:MAG: alpha/beta fold hydrolase [Dechloromonas sp.]|nr:alpha/beta fold hydrolase [Dechloromonas sp.]
MFRKWMAVMGCVLSFGAASLQAQEESVIKHGEMNVSVMTMGAGEHVVIALHGGGGTDRRFFFSGNGGEMGQALAAAGFRVIAPSWAGQAGAGFNEVAALVAHARETGATKISLMGHSRGGELAANYARTQDDGVFNTVIQFASVDDRGLPMTQTKKLFAYNKNDRWAAWQPKAFTQSAEPKVQIELGGRGHPVSDLIKEKADLVEDVVGLLKQ